MNRVRPTYLTSLAVLISISCGLGGTSARAETRFTIVDSSPTSWVARGYDNYTVAPSLGWNFNIRLNMDNSVQLWFDGPRPPGTFVDDWELVFAAPYNAPLTPGYYPNLSRYLGSGGPDPAMKFLSTSRLDNTAAGFFEVFEATYGPGGEVLSFAADFTHYGETNPNNYAIAEIRYNSTVPEPSTYIMAAMGVVALLFARRRKR